MEKILEVLSYLMGNWAEMLGYASAGLASLYSLALLIPGEQPDKAIKKLLELTKKLSRK